MPKLLLASSNKGKLLEMRSVLKNLEVELLTPVDLNILEEVAETGNSYADNALLKSTFYAKRSGLLTLADDSGLEVDALHGLPGIRSARFSNKKNASDADRRNFLLEQLQRFPRPWKAHFHCTVALVQTDLNYWIFEGQCMGEIIPEQRGYHGFGYDPIFLIPNLGLTMAEINIEQKNLISHRARAIQNAQPYLMVLLAS